MLLFVVASEKTLECTSSYYFEEHCRLIARYVMAAMLVVRNNKIFLLWELTCIFTQTM